jgi:cell division transport system permease protein
MKFIKNHLMFIFPLMAILFGVEFYLIFERSTTTYEDNLAKGYRMLVVTSHPVALDRFQNLNRHVTNSYEIERSEIIENVTDGISKESEEAILEALPYFYNLSLDAYLPIDELEEIKEDLQSDSNVKRVETFGSSYQEKYRLFAFIKFILELFISFMMIVSFFLVIKQMEVWKYQHKERMHIMETFGAPLMLRAGVLFKVAFIDAVLATLFVSVLFVYIKFSWAVDSGIGIVVEHQASLYHFFDSFILLFLAIVLVVTAVYAVVFSSKGIGE